MSRLWSKPPAAIEMRRRAWEAFVANPAAARTAAVIQRHVGRVACVLDAGCGAGQELLPYLRDAVCVGVDTDREALALGNRLLPARPAGANVGLICASVEALPLQPHCCDVVLSRVVLQRVDAARALHEMARVLRPGGGLVITFHHYRYYLRKLPEAWRTRDLRPMVYALRVLLTGLCFHVSGRHRSILGISETYLTHARLQRMARAAGLELLAPLPGGTAAAPMALFRRSA
jgi:SAM-dependent methyltransferase